MDRAGEICPTCRNGKLSIISQTVNGISYECDTCGAMHADVKGQLGVSVSASKIVATGGEKIRGKPVKQIQFKKGDKNGEMRIIISRSDDKTDVIQIAWASSGEIRHLDCKKCNIAWSISDANMFDDYFEVTGQRIKCKTCCGGVSYS